MAHNEEFHLERAVRSLLEQELPPGCRWSSIWVVASGCTDRTAEVALRLTEADSRVRLIVEADRGGKARALRRVFDRAAGDALVLLNGDARAMPGAVRELVRTASRAPVGVPWAVMGRPVPPPAQASGAWRTSIDLLWDLHHEFHTVLSAEGGGAHLSDELLMVGLPVSCPVPPGTINDGSYLGVWLAQRGGARLYAPGAAVETSVPMGLRDHLTQRRRIHFGNHQVRQRLGSRPTTIASRAVRDPRWAIEFLLRSVAGRPRRRSRLIALGAAEAAAYALALWDRVPPTKDHVRWIRIRPVPPPAPAAQGVPPPTVATLEERIGRLTRLAAEFRWPIGPAELLPLLPLEGPRRTEDLEAWLSSHPDVPGMAQPAEPSVPAATHLRSERLRRGDAYLAEATRLGLGPLAAGRAWLRCLAVSGSAAYGAPEAGDDLDLFAVARRGTVWWFLAFAFLRARLERWRGANPEAPTPCFNYVVDETEARRRFEVPQGLLFAREALTVRCLWGESYYRSLLRAAPWIGGVLPRLYASRLASPSDADGPSRPTWVARGLSVLVFPVLAAYLQLAGLRRNARLVREGRSEACFRTTTGWRGFVLGSRRFERIRGMYERPVVGLPTPSRSVGPGRVGPVGWPVDENAAHLA